MRELQRFLIPAAICLASFLILRSTGVFEFISHYEDSRKDQFLKTCQNFFEASGTDCEEFHSKYSGFMNR